MTHAHHFIIPATGVTAIGRCKICGFEREHINVETEANATVAAKRFRAAQAGGEAKKLAAKKRAPDPRLQPAGSKTWVYDFASRSK